MEEADADAELEPHYFKQLIPGPRICIYCGEEEDMTDDDSDDDDYQP